jgi:putative DNA-invertase from lambdoid prophage Rac
MGVSGYAKGGRHGEDVKTQRSAIRAYGRQHGLKVRFITVEEDERALPVYDRPCAGLFKTVKAGDVIIAARFGELFCSPADALHVVADLENRGVALHVVDLGCDMASVSKLFVTMATAFAAGQRAQTSERTLRHKADAKARGRYRGGALPFGWRCGDDGKLVLHDGEQEAIADMIAMKCVWTPLRAIAAAMVAKGHKISHEGVARVLRAHRDEVSAVVRRFMGGEDRAASTEDIEKAAPPALLARAVVQRSLEMKVAKTQTTPS